MKILLLDNSSLTPFDGDFCIEPKTGSFAKELLLLDNVVTLYGQKVESQDQFHSFKLLENGLKVIGLKRKRNKFINYILLYLRVIPEILKNDFVYIFYPSAYKYVALLCWLLSKPYGVYIRGEQGLNNRTSKFIYKKAFVIFTVTNHFTNMINDITNKNNAFTIRPMIPFTEKDIVVNRDYKTKSILKILFLGRITYDKGIKELLEAVFQLQKQYSNFELTLVGDGGYMQNAEALVKELNIKDKVTLVGAIDDSNKVSEYFKTSDIYILPTYHEGFPRTLYEAMIFGTPIITTFVGGIPALMNDGYNCKEIQPKSVDSIVEAVSFAINNYEDMITYAKNGAKTVASIVDSKKMTHAQHLNKIMKS